MRVQHKIIIQRYLFFVLFNIFHVIDLHERAKRLSLHKNIIDDNDVKIVNNIKIDL